MNYVRLLLAAPLVLVAGCSYQPIYDVNSASTGIYKSDFQPDEQQVEQAIMLGASRYGWQPEVIAPGLIHAKLQLRDYQATVEIPYSAKRYSIHHGSSEQLDYQGGQINPNYNRWVMNLSSSIQQQLSAEVFADTSEGGQIR